ncbi:1050_t:CDS:2 [Funneliformis mosseae]|uniref:1050_t:CDS:1 n=1 Tax=Funneliformis mosseae TaxID=27381 RepID=A0A9N9HCR5_FUNMO|nr:1050_t:CDS:2 [Funneliformis mosseae]
MSTSLNTITNKNKPELEELKITQEDSLNGFLVKLENHMTMVVKQTKTNKYTNDFKQLDDEDSNDLIESKFAFDYSKSFTNKANQKILKAYLLFYMKEYEFWDNNFKILGHPIREIKALFAQELISPKIKEIYYVPFIPWHIDEAIRVRKIIDAKVEQQPCPISPDFSQWAIKPYNLNTILYNAVDPDSEDDYMTTDLIIDSQPVETFNYGLTDLNNTHDRSSSTFSQIKLNNNFEKQSNDTSIESKEHRVPSEDAMINQKSAGPNKK